MSQDLFTRWTEKKNVLAIAFVAKIASAFIAVGCNRKCPYNFSREPHLNGLNPIDSRKDRFRNDSQYFQSVSVSMLERFSAHFKAFKGQI